MKAKDIIQDITTDYNHPGNWDGHAMDTDTLDQDVCCTVGDILTAGSQENKVIAIAYLGNAYSLEVRIDNGQKINMKQLNKLIENGQISVNICRI
jgi:hypothetical protein